MKPPASEEREIDMRQIMNLPQTTRTSRSKAAPRPQPLATDRADRIFHCHAAFLALLGVGAGEDELREGEMRVESGRVMKSETPKKPEIRTFGFRTSDFLPISDLGLFTH